MKLRCIIFITIFFFTLVKNINSKDLIILAKVNDSIITNYDLFLEIKLLEILENKDFSKENKLSLVQELIDLKIKEIEAKKNNIEANPTRIKNRVNTIVAKHNINNENLKKILKKKINIIENWNKLIVIKFKNKLEINMTEIREVVKNNNLSDDKVSKLINLERSKKINILSKNYFNQIKNNYFVKVQ